MWTQLGMPTCNEFVTGVAWVTKENQFPFPVNTCHRRSSLRKGERRSESGPTRLLRPNHIQKVIEIFCCQRLSSDVHFLCSICVKAQYQFISHPQHREYLSWRRRHFYAQYLKRLKCFNFQKKVQIPQPFFLSLLDLHFFFS